MKKFLYLIPIFIFLLLISPNKVHAAEFYKTYYYKELPLTEETKNEYLNTALNYDLFIEDSQKYPYYMIFYQEDTGYIGLTGYRDYIAFIYFDSIPKFKISDSSISLNYSDVSKHYLYYPPTNFKNNSGLSSINFFKYIDQVQDSNGNYNSKYYFLSNYVLSTNIELSLGYELKLYDSNDNLIKTYSADENIFADLNLKPKEDLTIETIEKSDNTLYNLSVELLGELPEEFTFLYSLVQLFLGIVIILVVLSPIIILLRLFR